MSSTLTGPQQESSDWDDWFNEALAAELHRRATRRRVAFWLLALVFAVTMLGTTLPTPLYVIYQARWHLSVTMVTVIFAAYAAAVLATLLLAGRSSDQAGRKPLLAVAALGLRFVPETVRPRRRPALRFAGLGVPDRGRGEFLAAAVAVFAAFALLGLFSSLAPGFIAGVLHQGNHAVQGAVVFLIFGAGAVTQVALARFSSRRVVLAGLGLLLAALGLIVAAPAEAAMALFLAGTAIGGVAAGAIFLGSLATANQLAPPERRGQVVSAFFVACYAGLIIPVVGVGVLSGFTGTFPAVLTFSLLLAVLSLFSLARIATALPVSSQARGSGGRRRPTARPWAGTR
jgi:MFS family permease